MAQHGLLRRRSSCPAIRLEPVSGRFNRNSARLPVGAHTGFSMFIWFWEKEIEEGRPVGGLWIDSRETLVTASVVGPLGIAP